MNLYVSIGLYGEGGDERYLLDFLTSRLWLVSLGASLLGLYRTSYVYRNETGMTVVVSVQVSRLSYTRGGHFIPAEQIKVMPGVTPTGDYTAYVGPKDFPLERIW